MVLFTQVCLGGGDGEPSFYKGFTAGSSGTVQRPPGHRQKIWFSTARMPKGAADQPSGARCLLRHGALGIYVFWGHSGFVASVQTARLVGVFPLMGGGSRP